MAPVMFWVVNHPLWSCFLSQGHQRNIVLPLTVHLLHLSSTAADGGVCPSLYNTIILTWFYYMMITGAACCIAPCVQASFWVSVSNLGAVSFLQGKNSMRQFWRSEERRCFISSLHTALYSDRRWFLCRNKPVMNPHRRGAISPPFWIIFRTP